MKKYFPLLILTVLLAFSCQDDDEVMAEKGIFAVANRGGGTVSLIDASTQTLIQDITLPGEGGAPSYVVFSKEKDRLYVADFNNAQVHAYSADGFGHITSYEAGAGAFHMWVNDRANQIWVNNIVDKTTSVIDTHSGATLATLPLAAPGIEFAEDAAQHDVTMSPNGRNAYVSIFSQTGQNYVIQYNTNTFAVKNAAEVGGDPHLSVNNSNLYILSQDDSNINEYKFGNLTPTGKTASIPNAHGITPKGQRGFFVTNISGREVVNYNSNQNQIKSTVAAQADAGVAHNVAYSQKDKVVALTISGGTTTEFFKVQGGNLSQLSTLTTGGNPFGIWFFEVPEMEMDEEPEDS